MVRRVALVLVALVVAGLGGLLVVLYAERADERALAALAPVDVLVARTEVPAGTDVADAVAAGSLETVPRPAAALPDGYVTGEGVEAGDVVLVTLYRNEVLLEQKVGDPGAQPGLTVPDERLAASFTLGDPNRVADFVTPGSSVAVFVTADLTPAQPGATDEGLVLDAPPTRTTRLLLPEVEVIAVGGTTTRTTTTTDAAGQQQTTETNLSLLTLALTQPEAERMILAQNLGELYLGLLGETSVIEPGPGAQPGTLFEGSAP